MLAPIRNHPLAAIFDTEILGGTPCMDNPMWEKITSVVALTHAQNVHPYSSNKLDIKILQLKPNYRSQPQGQAQDWGRHSR